MVYVLNFDFKTKIVNVKGDNGGRAEFIYHGTSLPLKSYIM